MNTESTIKTSHGGMMYSHDFRLWYTYLKRRIKKEWRPEELSFLLGKPNHAYLDFERMFQVEKFLTQESILLDRIYASSWIEAMEFHREEYEISEERLVRLKIEEDEVKWNYTIELPWQFEKGEEHPPAPELQFEEWKAEKDLQLESDAMLHVRQKLDVLLDGNYFENGATALQMFRKVEHTGLVHLQIFPRHLKNVLYGLIQQNKLVVRNIENSFSFFLTDFQLADRKHYLLNG
ncbi:MULTISPECIES: hypothetical protein [Sphingobacterium]|uniref:Uncharacterized protein n=1 Tax=Sphingobacterium ginsenosidimutans TaxID=687845 RepID=A0ABP7ZZQ7_9SPHI|nr:hypothetical protein [Sphingobacterium sp. E70]ULT27643.1 hypothetical protein KUH03_13600 [Sphingobacterium sp. E70]